MLVTTCTCISLVNCNSGDRVGKVNQSPHNQPFYTPQSVLCGALRITPYNPVHNTVVTLIQDTPDIRTPR